MKTTTFATLALSILSSAAYAASTSITASVDGDVHYGGPGPGYSVDDTGAVVSTSMSGGFNVSKGIFEFDLSSISAGSRITSVNLHLGLFGSMSNTGDNPVPVTLYGYTGDGTVSVADYLAPTVQVGYRSFNPDNHASGDVLTFSFSNVAPVQTAFDSTNSIAGIRLETISFASFRAASLENTNDFWAHPVLEVSYTAVPEPSSQVLLGVGVVFLLSRRKRHES